MAVAAHPAVYVDDVSSEFTQKSIKPNTELEEKISWSDPKQTDLSWMKLTDEDIPLVIEGAMRQKKCTWLNFSGNKITSAGVKMLVGELKTNTTLKTLYLSYNRSIGDEGVRYLAEKLFSTNQNRTLTGLFLSHMDISDRGMIPLSKALETNSILTGLYIHEAKLITDASVDSIMRMLERNRTLERLYLQQSSLSEKGKERLKKRVGREERVRLLL